MRSRLEAHAGALAVAVLAVVLHPVLSGFEQQIAMTVAVMAIAASGVALLIGRVPRHGHPLLISFGHAAYLGIGAYVTTIVQREWHWNFFPALVVAVAVGVLLATLIGFPGSRMGVFGLGLVTFSTAFVVEVILKGGILIDLTGGDRGLPAEPLDLFGRTIKASEGLYWVIAIALVVAMVVRTNFSASRRGVALRVMQESELAASAFGVHRVRAKVVAFAVASVYGTVAGALLGQLVGFISPYGFEAAKSIDLFAMAIIGGTAVAIGPVIGATVFVVSPEVLSFAGEDSQIIFSLALLVVLIFAPTGISGVLGKAGSRARSLVTSGRKMPGREVVAPRPAAEVEHS